MEEVNTDAYHKRWKEKLRKKTLWTEQGTDQWRKHWLPLLMDSVGSQWTVPLVQNEGRMIRYPVVRGQQKTTTQVAPYRAPWWSAIARTMSGGGGDTRVVRYDHKVSASVAAAAAPAAFVGASPDGLLCPNDFLSAPPPPWHRTRQWILLMTDGMKYELAASQRRLRERPPFVDGTPFDTKTTMAVIPRTPAPLVAVEDGSQLRFRTWQEAWSVKIVPVLSFRQALDVRRHTDRRDLRHDWLLEWQAMLVPSQDVKHHDINVKPDVITVASGGMGPGVTAAEWQRMVSDTRQLLVDFPEFKPDIVEVVQRTVKLNKPDKDVTVYVLRTHLWDALIQENWERMCAELGADNVWILYDLTNGVTVPPELAAIRDKQVFYVTEAMCLKYNPLHRKMYDNVETPLLMLYDYLLLVEQHPYDLSRRLPTATPNKFEFVYVIEYDVACRGHWREILDGRLIAADRYHMDFLACSAQSTRERNTPMCEYWYRWTATDIDHCPPKPNSYASVSSVSSGADGANGDVTSNKWENRFVTNLQFDRCYICFFPVTRCSRRFLDRLRTKYLGKVTAYCETFFPTVAAAEPDLLMDSLPHNQLAVFRYSPVIRSIAGYSKEGLYHPVRVLTVT